MWWEWKLRHGCGNVAILVGNVWMFGEPGGALAGGGFVKAEPGKPLFAVEEGASNGGVRDFLRFWGWKMESG